jgi:diguanylate cyclase (GGDEF)-like protein
MPAVSAALARFILATSLLLITPSSVMALDSTKALTQFIHTIWQTKDGLPQNTVTAIAQTSDGYLWLGTREGLARFDGVRFTVFTSESTPELAQSQILSLLADRKGRLWIGTWGGGLTLLEGGRFTRFSAAEGLPSDLIAAIFEDRQGRIWVGTDGGGAARLDGRRFVAIPSRDALGKQVRAIAEDDTGMWLGSEAGLVHLRHDGTLVSYTETQGLVHHSVRSLLLSKSGMLWIGTDHGADRFAKGAFQHFPEGESLAHDLVLALEEDRDGNIWVGSDARGLKRWRDGATSVFSSREGLSNDSVYSLLEDREGHLWIGTNLGGLNRLRQGLVTPFAKREGLSHDYLRSIFEDRDGDLWIGTEGGGVNRLKGGTVAVYTTKQGLSNDTVFSIVQDRAGDMWFGTDSGLTRMRDGRLQSMTIGTPYANFAVLALFEDRDGALWLGTYANGLIRYRDGVFTSFSRKDGLSHETVNVIAQDREGNLWIGTRGGGLNRFRDGKFASFTKKDGLADDLVFALHEAPDGSLWIGTYGGGLSRMKNGRWSSVTRKQGLFDDVVHRIIDDGVAHLWMSTNRGIFRVARHELDEVADGTRATLTSVVYGPLDGMRNAECNGGASAGVLTRDGRVWFPTIEGAVAIDSRLATTRTPEPPPVLVEEIFVDGRLANPETILALAPTAQTLAVNFTALSLSTPEAIRFRYRMEGLEQDWVDADTRRTAYYSKLPPGRYRFHVSAANADGIWNEAGAAFALAVTPNWYETPWFRGGMVLALLLAGPLFYRERIRRFTAKQLALEGIIAERTSALETANTLLARLAREDGLTGLLNRRAFDAALHEEWRRATRGQTPLSLLLIDIDAFKAFNDQLGHQAGDACLRAVSEAIASASRRAGELVARYGGEELAVIIPVDLPASVAKQAEHLRALVEALAIAHPGSPVASIVTVSIGVAFRTTDVLSTGDLVAQADRALYQAKQRGRNRVEIGGSLP